MPVEVPANRRRGGEMACGHEFFWGLGPVRSKIRAHPHPSPTSSPGAFDPSNGLFFHLVYFYTHV